MTADEIRDLAGWNSLVSAEPNRVSQIQVIVMGEGVAQLAELNAAIRERFPKVPQPEPPSDWVHKGRSRDALEQILAVLLSGAEDARQRGVVLIEMALGQKTR